MTEKMKPRIILSDVDGVLVCWGKAFKEYMGGMGYETIAGFEGHYSLAKQYNFPKTEMIKVIEDFNTSEHIRNLEPYRDAKEYVCKLRDQDFDFIAISSMSADPQAHEYRLENLGDLYGHQTFSEVICLPIGGDKYSTLERWENTGYFWIEDKFSNAMDGAALGLKSILIDAPYNRGFEGRGITRVADESPWKSIYYMVAKEYNL